MSKFLAGLGGASGVTVAGAVGVIIAGAAAWVQFGREDTMPETPAALIKPEPAPAVQEPAPAVVQETENTTAPEVETATAEPATTEPDPAAPNAEPDVTPAPAPNPPAFDEVRREADGMTVIAGRAAPGAVVQILQDGAEIATTTADGAGKFAALMMILPDGQAHALSLMQVIDGTKILSEGEIILAPLSAPVVVAEAETSVEAAAPQTSGVIEQAAPAAQASETAETASNEAASELSKDVIAEDGTQPETQVAKLDEAITDKAEPSAAKPAPAAAPEVQEPAIDTAQPVTDVAAIAEPKAEPVETDAVVTEAGDGPAAAAPVATAAVDAPAAPKQETLAASQKIEAPAAQTQTAAGTDTATATQPAPVTSVGQPLKEETPSPAQVAVLKSTSDGVELLNPVTPVLNNSVALDTISYAENGDVLLSGRAQGETRTVRAYLNNDAIADFAVAADGRWGGTVPDIAAGIYTLRVDGISASGSVTHRLETPFKRESQTVLAEATQNLDGPIKAITVQKGATLWAIARERYGDGLLYVRVFDANRGAIRDPDLIYPGQVFDLPD